VKTQATDDVIGNYRYLVFICLQWKEEEMCCPSIFTVYEMNSQNTWIFPFLVETVLYKWPLSQAIAVQGKHDGYLAVTNEGMSGRGKCCLPTLYSTVTRNVGKWEKLVRFCRISIRCWGLSVHVHDLCITKRIVIYSKSNTRTYKWL